MATESGSFLLSLLPLMVLRAHLLALSLPLSSQAIAIFPSGMLYSLSHCLAGFTTQFEDSPYRAPSSTLLVPEYSENSEAAGGQSKHMSTEFLRDPRNDEHGILKSCNES